MHLDIPAWTLILVKLLVALLCGGIVGFERERFDHPAGLRTHIMVCVGAAIYMLVSVAVAGERFDPARIAAQVATGVGFLGAGTIIKQGSIVRGLTTAASLWAVAGIGLAAGFSLTTMGIALLGTLIVLIALESMKRVEERMEHRRTFALTIALADPRGHADEIRALLRDQHIELFGFSFHPDATGAGSIVFEGVAASRAHMQAVIDALGRLPYITGVTWEYQ